MEVVRLATPKASGRGRPQKSASAAVCAPDVKFPVKSPKPREIKPEECVVRIVAASDAGVQVVVLPKESAVRRILNETFGALAWGDSYYYTKNWWRCQIEILSPVNGLPVRKDAGPLALPSYDVDRMQENTSFLRAAAMFGVAEDVMDLKQPIDLDSKNVPVQRGDNGCWHVEEKLTIDQFGRSEDGHIQMIQFALPSGKKFLWPEA